MRLLDETASVGRWVTERPELSQVFEELNIDYCCGGDKSLAQACREKDMESAELVQRLRAYRSPVEADGGNWMQSTLTELCDHIESTHHRYLRRQLPRLTELLAKVVEVHGTAHPELLEIRRGFGDLRAELEPHMLKEERVLFPAIRQLEQSAQVPEFPFGTVSNPIRVMHDEHDAAGRGLARLRELTDGFTPPDDACRSYTTLFDGLLELETDLHQHIHKENNILFPRAMTLETQSR